MEIEVKLFANFRDYLPKGSNKFSSKVKVGTSERVADVLRKLGLPEDYPKIILINGVHAKEDDKLKDGDVLSVFPPVAGGTRETWFAHGGAFSVGAGNER